MTIPHKRAALAVATDPTERAAAIGAANTLTFDPGGTIAADNTDAPALIERAPSPARGRDRALVLGAGGSARAASGRCAARASRPGDLEPHRRAGAGARCRVRSDRAVTERQAAGRVELLVNCTAVGLHGADPFGRCRSPRQLPDYRCVVDLVYSRGYAADERPRAAGAATVDGLELLVGQGALSFELFTGPRRTRCGRGARLMVQRRLTAPWRIVRAP